MKKHKKILIITNTETKKLIYEKYTLNVDRGDQMKKMIRFNDTITIFNYKYKELPIYKKILNKIISLRKII
jgi:hypothetical protein